MRDLALVDVDDGAEAVVVGGAVRQERAVDLVLDDNYALALCLVDDEMVGGVELDGLDVTAKLAHEGGASAHDTRPSPEVVEDLVDGVLVHDVEEVLPIDEVTERASNELEVGRGGLVRGVGMAGHGSSTTLTSGLRWTHRSLHGAHGQLLRHFDEQSQRWRAPRDAGEVEEEAGDRRRIALEHPLQPARA